MATSKYSYGCTQFPSSNLEWKTTCEIIPHLEKKNKQYLKQSQLWNNCLQLSRVLLFWKCQEIETNKWISSGFYRGTPNM